MQCNLYDFDFGIFDKENFKEALSDAVDMVRWITDGNYGIRSHCQRSEKEKLLYSQVARYFADLYREPNSDMLSSLCGCIGAKCNKKSCQIIWEGIMDSKEMEYVFLIAQKILSEEEKEIYVKKEKE